MREEWVDVEELTGCPCLQCGVQLNAIKHPQWVIVGAEPREVKNFCSAACFDLWRAPKVAHS